MIHSNVAMGLQLPDFAAGGGPHDAPGSRIARFGAETRYSRVFTVVDLEQQRWMPSIQRALSRARPMTRIRHRLLLIATVAIIPLAVMAAVALEALLAQQRGQAEESALNLTRALATSVDNELRLTVSALQSLALTEPFGATSDEGLAEARVLAMNVLAARPEWRAVLLMRPSGEVVLNTALPANATSPRVNDLTSVDAAVRTGAPAVGPLTAGPTGYRGVPVRVPVVRDGTLRYVLSAVVKPEAIVAVINRQRVPADWIVSVFDANNARVARSRDHDKLLGTQPDASLLKLLAALNGDDESFGQSSTFEGNRVNTALARIKSSGWTVTLGVPRLAGEQALHRSVLVFGGGLALSIALGALLALVASRRIEHAIARLRSAAAALGRGEPVQLTSTGIAEIEATSEALVAAAARRAQSERERESLLDAERSARATAEQAERRLQLLAAASSMLSNSLEEASALQTIATSIVPDIADLCRIDLLNADGVLERKLTHHFDVERTKAISAWVAQSVASAAAPGTFPWAIATGQTFVAHFDEGQIAAIADPGVAEFVRVVRLRAACVMPLVARGRTIGAMAVIQAESGRRFEPDDVALVGEIARRAALALDNVRLFAESRAALAQAQSAGRVKDEFLAMLGHELRNPLAPIVTSLELMARRNGAGDSPERHVIERQVRHLARLVDDLLDVSRIAAGKVELHKETVDLRHVVERALELAQPALAGRFAPPVVSLPAQPVWVDGDPVRLAQVVCNLLTNAAKFSSPTGRIGIELQHDRSDARLTVDDDGDGIPRELLGHIFERFVQGDQSLQRARGGLGLGLAIVRNIVELHHGTVAATSAGPGMGSRFTVTLPETLAPTSPVPAPITVASAPPAVHAAPPPSQILVVDDNEDAAHAIAVLLELEGHTVRTAATAREALVLVGELAPDVAFLDIGLPDLNGYELARAIRADPRAARIRLVALTGYGREPDQELAAQAGFDQHLVKPAEIEDLLAALVPAI
jgi:signal transduction histidine kinase/CheY-like chemotaxis protein